MNATCDRCSRPVGRFVMSFSGDGWTRHAECMTPADWATIKPPHHGCELPPSCPGCGATTKADHGEDCGSKGWPDDDEDDEDDRPDAYEVWNAGGTPDEVNNA